MTASKHVVIVGNGIAGITAARFIRKSSDWKVTVVSAESDHFFSRTALMYVYMGHMTFTDTKPYEDWFWRKNRIGLVRGHVDTVDVSAKKLLLDGTDEINYDVLILATGSRSNKLGWPGVSLTGVQGLYSLQDLEMMEERTGHADHAVVVGGGLIGIEMAEMLHSRRIGVTFLVREKSYMDHLLPTDESEMVNAEIRSNGIDLRLATELREVLGDTHDQVRAVETDNGEEIACQFVGLAVGVQPNIGFVGRSPIETNRGVLVNEFFETSEPDVYAVGDCAEFRDPAAAHKTIEQLWYTARRHGRTVADTVVGQRTAYNKGIFFNSAKFFNLEYQVYGDIRPVPAAGVESLLWKHPSQRKLVRINYHVRDRRVIGFNLLGLRFRHTVCEKWIRNHTALEAVLNNLDQANFDPEFSKRFARDARDALIAQWSSKVGRE